MSLDNTTSAAGGTATLSEIISAVPMASIYAGYSAAKPFTIPAMPAEKLPQYEEPKDESPVYLLCGLDRKIREKVLEEAWNAKRSGRLPHFDAIAVAGVSGLIVGSVLAAMWSCNLFVIRKPGESSHSASTVEGPNHVGRYLIVDDFVASGATVNRIRSLMSRHRPQGQCVGVYVYVGDGGTVMGVPIINGGRDFLNQEIPF